MLYTFVKKDGNVERIGDVDEASVNAKVDEYVANGFERAEAEDWDAQVITGAANSGEDDDAAAGAGEAGEGSDQGGETAAAGEAQA